MMRREILTDGHRASVPTLTAVRVRVGVLAHTPHSSVAGLVIADHPGADVIQVTDPTGRVLAEAEVPGAEYPVELRTALLAHRLEHAAHAATLTDYLED